MNKKDLYCLINYTNIVLDYIFVTLRQPIVCHCSIVETKIAYMKDTNIWFLEEVNLFEYFCPFTGAEDRYQAQGKRSYKKGEFIYFSDDLSDKVFFIHKGAVKIASYTDEGDEMIKAVLNKGEVFGELAVYGEQRRSDYAQAIEPTEVCILSREDTTALMQNLSGFQNFLMGLIGRRIIFTQKRLESLLFKDAKTRITEYVIQQAESKGRTLGGQVVMKNHLTHQEIANYTGTSRQTVTTVLNQLREANFIDFNRKRMTVKDIKALKGSIR